MRTNVTAYIEVLHRVLKLWIECWLYMFQQDSVPSHMTQALNIPNHVISKFKLSWFRIPWPILSNEGVKKETNLQPHNTNNSLKAIIDNSSKEFLSSSFQGCIESILKTENSFIA